MPRPATQVKKYPPRTEEAKAKNRAALAKARASRSEKARQRRITGMGEPGDLRSYPERPAGATWMLDEVIQACLSHDDAIESRRIVDAMIYKASTGNVQAAQFLSERAQGKPLQKIQVSGGLTLETMDDMLPDVPEVPGGNSVG